MDATERNRIENLERIKMEARYRTLKQITQDEDYQAERRADRDERLGARDDDERMASTVMWTLGGGGLALGALVAHISKKDWTTFWDEIGQTFATMIACVVIGAAIGFYRNYMR